ncbi:MAG: type IV pili twitching motility protein PilT [Deltaproteobacteria bacterium RIFCSPLOWO2_02_FULL_47_10]|nr:MAG: type IV pili twitching motility protein PilT [Deltaproteobacteria bacterium RIFCSPLOWO2_02_FULL_47_10]
MATLQELLKKTIDSKASDLHICAGYPPQMRVDGSLKPVPGTKALSNEEAKTICFEALDEGQKKKLIASREIDLSFSVGKNARIRANIFYQMGTVAGAFRSIPYIIPSPSELGIPDIVMKLTERPRGLVLVTGPTGSGKSTTLAAMINRANETRPDHITTIEDPIEYIYQPKKALVNQREVGSDTANFATALKYILRQDPDVVLIGEMRDLETVQAAITTAETGHLVLATLHTNTAVQTIDRIVDVFPPHHQPQIRAELSFILEGVISQQLLPKIGGGRALAMEMLFPTVGMRNLIREAKTHQIYSQMQMGQDQSGMQTMNQALAKLVRAEVVSYEDGLSCCTDGDEFKNLAGRTKRG